MHLTLIEKEEKMSKLFKGLIIICSLFTFLLTGCGPDTNTPTPPGSEEGDNEDPNKPEPGTGQQSQSQTKTTLALVLPGLAMNKSVTLKVKYTFKGREIIAPNITFDGRGVGNKCIIFDSSYTSDSTFGVTQVSVKEMTNGEAIKTQIFCDNNRETVNIQNCPKTGLYRYVTGKSAFERRNPQKKDEALKEWEEKLCLKFVSD